MTTAFTSPPSASACRTWLGCQWRCWAITAPAFIAKSYEMKAAGVSTGVPIWDALGYLPTGNLRQTATSPGTKSSRAKCWRSSRSSAHKWSSNSIDEMFFQAVDPSLAAAYRLQQQVMEQIKIPVSVGIAPTKTLAKLGLRFVQAVRLPHGGSTKPIAARFWTIDR